MKRILIALALVLSAAVAVPAVAHKGKGKSHGHRPDVIALPNGFQPEGIATAKRHRFFVGSRDNGAIYRGNLRTGEGAILVPGGGGKQATGLKVDRFRRLFVSGAGSKAIRVYDSRTGAEIRSYPVPDAGFINDNVVTRRGVYFTDSNVPQLYFIPFGRKGALGELQRIPITGDFVYGAGFNANGIEAVKGGRTLILVKSSDPGKLYTADAKTGVTKEIALDKPVTNGDGLLLQGRKLYVVLNQDDVVRQLRLSRDLTSATTVRDITRDEFDVPTTIARSGGRNYVVNAKFNSASPATDSYEVVRVPKK
jgi:streptogramin lyase